ncbi:MAG: hypothetical protein U0166_13930 [Acidobacteriota bacterium]
MISHDRWFSDRVATHILAFEGDSEVFWYEGNFESYEVDKKRRLGKDAEQPHRPKFKKLTRPSARGSRAGGQARAVPATPDCRRRCSDGQPFRTRDHRSRGVATARWDSWSPLLRSCGLSL